MTAALPPGSGASAAPSMCGTVPPFTPQEHLHGH
jgi:hypothetical protein